MAVSIAYSGSLSVFESIPARVERQFVLALNFISDRERQVAQWQRAKEEAWARVRTARELPRIEGSVDVIPSIQSSLLAYGLDYRPRYSFQEYQTFTSHLIEANRRSLIERGPAFLLFAPESIDGRFPAMAEGPLWPDILAAYRPVSEDGKLLLLRRREQRVENALRAGVVRTIGFGDSVVVPDGPQFLQAKIGKTFLGRLVDVLFRPPIIWMKVSTSDGTERPYRVIPAIAQAGFLVSPMVASASDFLLLYQDQTARLPATTRVSFETTRFGRYVYASQVEVSLSSLSVDLYKIDR